MLYIQENRLFFKYDDSPDDLFFEVKIGDKIWDCTDPYDKDKCLKLEQTFRQAGFNTRIGQGEDKRWSVAIIE